MIKVVKSVDARTSIVTIHGAVDGRELAGTNNTVLTIPYTHNLNMLPVVFAYWGSYGKDSNGNDNLLGVALAKDTSNPGSIEFPTRRWWWECDATTITFYEKWCDIYSPFTSTFLYTFRFTLIGIAL